MAAELFTDNEKQQLVDAIARAEKNTSGEIRIHIDKKCESDVLSVAVAVFKKLKMDKTAQRNAVLFYLATESKKFAIIGDEGINKKVPVGFWDDIKNNMQQKFKNNEFTAGLIGGIDATGIQLKAHFPYQSDDKNELTNELSFGK